jgi:hypothetical protein
MAKQKRRARHRPRQLPKPVPGSKGLGEWWQGNSLVDYLEALCTGEPVELVEPKSAPRCRPRRKVIDP